MIALRRFFFLCVCSCFEFLSKVRADVTSSFQTKNALLVILPYHQHPPSAIPSVCCKCQFEIEWALKLWSACFTYIEFVVLLLSLPRIFLGVLDITISVGFSFECVSDFISVLVPIVVPIRSILAVDVMFSLMSSLLLLRVHVIAILILLLGFFWLLKCFVAIAALAGIVFWPCSICWYLSCLLLCSCCLNSQCCPSCSSSLHQSYFRTNLIMGLEIDNLILNNPQGRTIDESSLRLMAENVLHLGEVSTRYSENSQNVVFESVKK